MDDFFEKFDINRETIDDWFEILDESENHTNFTYSVKYFWKVRKMISEKQIRAIIPYVYAAYIMNGLEQDWNAAWDQF